MKKLKTIGTLCALLLLYSCTNEDVKFELPSNNQLISKNVKAINNYIARNHPAISRSESAKLCPIIHEGDTVAFLANYDKGWELFSNNTDLPMVLMKAKTGSFYPNTSVTVSPFESYYNEMIESLTSTSYSETPNQTWTLYNEGRPGSGGDDNGDNGGDDGNTPEWEWVGDALERTTDVYTPKGGRLETKWNQGDNFSQYTPFCKYSPKYHSLVGCVAVAAGQLLYHTHKHWGVPQTTVTTATYNIDSNTYTFSGSDSNIWDLMYRGVDENFSNNAELMKPTAIFLGYVAKEIKSNFGESYNSATTASLYDCLPFLSSNFRGVLHDKEYLDYRQYYWDGVRIMLNNGYPILAFSSIDKGGHTYVIDYGETDTEDWYEIYSYPVKNDSNIDDTDNELDDMAPSIDFYKKKYGDIEIVKTSSISNSWMQMNWGWGGNHDDVMINTDAVEWVVGSRHYTDHWILLLLHV